jgi:hypothetical protein
MSNAAAKKNTIHEEDHCQCGVARSGLPRAHAVLLLLEGDGLSSRVPYGGEDFIPGKVVILLRHLVDKVAVPDLWGEHQLQRSVLHQWQRPLFENMPARPMDLAARTGLTLVSEARR